MSATPELCRVVLITPHRTLELALPTAVPVCDLLPVLVQRATTFGGPELAGRGGKGRGLTGEGDWVIQRLGSGPLDEELTPDALQIRDGETLYLRPRDAQLPPAHFDDLIDGLATGVRARGDRWADSMTRGLFVGLGGLSLLVVLVVLLDPGFRPAGPVAAVIGALLLVGAGLFSRTRGDGWAGLLCGLAAVPFAGMAGYLLPGQLGRLQAGTGQLPPSVLALFPVWDQSRLELAAPSLLAAFAAGTGAAVIAMGVTGTHRPVFLGVWLTGIAAALGCILVLVGLQPAQAAGAVVTLALILSTFTPSVSFRLARLRLPQLPTGAADLSEDIEPYPAPELMAGAALADSFLTGLLLAVGAVCTAGTVLVLQRGGIAYGMVAALAVVLLIRSRGVSSAWQRAAYLAPALTGLAMLAVHFADHPDPLHRLLALTGLVFLAGVLGAISLTLPSRRLLPYWGRLADIGEYLAAGALLVLLLGVLDAFQWARALAG